MPSSVTCPNCSAVLASEGLVAGQMVQCPYCRSQFSLSAHALAPQTSGKAISSLVLGLASLVGICLTGIPAIILGILALSDIRRQAGRLTGRGLAIAGITTGSLFGLLCGPVVVFILGSAVWVGRSFQFAQDPAAVAVVASRIGTYRVPPGIEPIGAMDMGVLGIKMAVYGDRKEDPSSMILLMQFPALMAGNRQQMNLQMQQQMQMQGFQAGIKIDDTKQLTYTVRGEEVLVTEYSGSDPETGDRVRQYIAMLSGEGGPVMVMIFTHEEMDETEFVPADEQPISLSEEQVQEFFESFE